LAVLPEINRILEYRLYKPKAYWNSILSSIILKRQTFNECIFWKNQRVKKKSWTT
jgi:hypothetical protein